MTDGHDTELQPILARFEDGWPELVDVGPGWHRLLIELDAQLSELDSGYRVQQVKTKFGSLSFYARASNEPGEYNEEFHETIRAAEGESINRCEECGSPARTYTIQMWVWTLCEAHAALKRGRDCPTPADASDQDR